MVWDQSLMGEDVLCQVYSVLPFFSSFTIPNWNSASTDEPHICSMTPNTGQGPGNFGKSWETTPSKKPVARKWARGQRIRPYPALRLWSAVRSRERKKKRKKNHPSACFWPACLCVCVPSACQCVNAPPVKQESHELGAWMPARNTGPVLPSRESAAGASATGELEP